MSSINAKKFTVLFEDVPASIAFVMTKADCDVLASIAFVFTKSACVQLSLQAWDLCPQIRLLRQAPNPYAAKREEERLLKRRYKLETENMTCTCG